MTQRERPRTIQHRSRLSALHSARADTAVCIINPAVARHTTTRAKAIGPSFVGRQSELDVAGETVAHHAGVAAVRAARQGRANLAVGHLNVVVLG